MNAQGVSNVGQQRRVVITGMGWVTPLGFDVDSVWTKLLSGASAIGPVTHFPAETFPDELRGGGEGL